MFTLILLEMKVLNIFLFAVGMFVLITGLAILRPVPIVKESECKIVSGVVASIYEGGERDVVFKLQNDQTRYYINRGSENGLMLQDLQDRLEGQEVTIKYPKYWTPLDWDNSIRHLSKLEYKDSIIFNECKEG